MFSNGSPSLWALSLGLLFAILALTTGQRKSKRILSSPDIPVTDFSCEGRPPGYYADVETGCQVYHMCAEGGQQFSYKCPNTTLFQQRMLICAHWYQVNCSRSESHYDANLLIGQRDKPFINENENTYYVNRKRVVNLTNPEILQHLNPSARDLTVRQPKSQVGEAQLNQLEKYNSKRSDENLVGNLGSLVQNGTRNTAVDNGGVHNTNVGQNTQPKTKTQFNSFNKNTFPTFKPTLTTHSQTFKNAFTQEVKITPAPQFRTFPPVHTNTPRQYEQEIRGLKANDAPPTRVEMEKSTFNGNVFNIQPTEYSTTTAKYEILNSNPTEIAPPVDFVPPSFVGETSEISTKYPDLPNDEFNMFINRFNPNEEIPTTTPKQSETTEYYTFIDRFNPNIDNTIASGMSDSETVQSRTNQFNLIKVPIFDLEPPSYDSDESDSNKIELHFQDPRRTFFIPASGSGELSNADDVPIVVTIPLHTAADSPPMWFRTEKSKDPCSRCHPSFVVNKNNCMPCVIIR